jgi:predicted anti-sigma-YlaC factor YlaD
VQARESASLRLDGELPELDDARLDAHLRGCAGCRVFAQDLAAVAAGLRAAPLEQPSPAMFIPRPRRTPAILLRMAAAAAVLVAAVAGSSFALGRALGTSASPPAPRAASSADLQSVNADSFEQQHLLAMQSRLQSVVVTGGLKRVPPKAGPAEAI